MSFVGEDSTHANTVLLHTVPTHPHRPGPKSSHHDHEEWEAMKPFIREIYIKDNRPLKELMLEMERRHGFKATVRMYKKHFSDWNLRKYRERSTDKQLKRVVVRSGSQLGSCQQPASPLTPLTAQLQDIPCHRKTLSLFHNISWFNEVKLESMLTLEAGVPKSSLEFTPLQTFHPVESVEVYGLFAFATSLFRRDLGHLAGKAIRKAFIVVERAMQKLDVHFMWNFVDIMYGMVLRGQEELLQLFLSHIAALSSRLLHTRHPIAEAFKQLADSSNSEKMATVAQAWRCSYNSIRRWLHPWCEAVDAITSMETKVFESSHTIHGQSSNFLIVKGLASHVLDREIIRRDNVGADATTIGLAECEFRQLRIKYNTIVDVVDLLGPAQLTRDDLVMDPFSIQKNLEFKAWGLALKGRVHQHLANKQFDQARIGNDQIREVAAKYAGLMAHSDLKYLQHLCTIEDELYRVGSKQYAQEIGESIHRLTDDFLKDIPDNTG
ncbi:putative Clr5 domain-containing protein [Seiridium cardinale]|uniref:Clr5 domain-containing protein n=1 Tax=Seiridium cardinale TaxID=138064 RepID=A0ABR2Y6R9_9PEZI